MTGTILSAECIVSDKESGSKAVLPLEIQTGCVCTKYKTDRADRVIQTPVCDFLIVFEKDNYKISCLTELKGTSGKKEVEHAYEQIRMTIDEVRNDYLQNSKMSVALIVGAMDKTLPRMISREKRMLCKALFANTQDKKTIKSMDKLIVYIQPDKGIKRASLIQYSGYTIIKCHTKRGAHVVAPEMIYRAVATDS